MLKPAVAIGDGISDGEARSTVTIFPLHNTSGAASGMYVSFSHPWPNRACFPCLQRSYHNPLRVSTIL